MKLYVATGNAHKLKEISEILPDVKLYINTAAEGSDVQMLLPLESLVDNGG